MPRQERNKERSQSRAENEHARERKTDRENVEGSERRTRERKRGDDFRERGLRDPPRRGAESRQRAFSLPLSGPLSRPLFSLFFFALGRRRGARARCFSSPADRVDFSFRASARPRPRVTMAAYPKIRRWGGTLFRDPRASFSSEFPSRLNPLSRAPSFFSSLLPVLPLSSVLFFSPFFFCPGYPSASTLPPTSI